MTKFKVKFDAWWDDIEADDEDDAASIAWDYLNSGDYSPDVEEIDEEEIDEPTNPQRTVERIYKVTIDTHLYVAVKGVPNETDDEDAEAAIGVALEQLAKIDDLFLHPAEWEELDEEPADEIVYLHDSCKIPPRPINEQSDTVKEVEALLSALRSDD